MTFWYEYREVESAFSKILIAYWSSNDLFLFLYLSTCNNKLLNHFTKHRTQLKWYRLFKSIYVNEHNSKISKTYLVSENKALSLSLSSVKLNYIDKDLLFIVLVSISNGNI